jgi:hypothetical protein
MAEFGSGPEHKLTRATTWLEQWPIALAATAIAAAPEVYLALKSDPGSILRFNPQMLWVGVGGLVALGIVGHAFRLFETMRYRQTASNLTMEMREGDAAAHRLGEVMQDLAALSDDTTPSARPRR